MSMKEFFENKGKLFIGILLTFSMGFTDPFQKHKVMDVSRNERVKKANCLIN
jgi:hypothetical protein